MPRYVIKLPKHWIVQEHSINVFGKTFQYEKINKGDRPHGREDATSKSLLVMEGFGYPDLKVDSTEELLEQQYANREHLRPVYDEIINLAKGCGEIVIEVRKTHVSLVAAKRTFARIQPRKTRVELGLRLKNCIVGGRIQFSRIHHTMRVQISLTTPKEVDDEVRQLLNLAYAENC